MSLTWKDVIYRASNANPAPPRRDERTLEAWRAVLTPEQFQITRLKGTERAHSSDMCSLFVPGVYACVCCKTPLFDSETKYESGTGWPSFSQPVDDTVVAYHADDSLAMQRIEATCNVCDAHLGHTFPDGPAPSGLRYCMNAIALEKI